MHRLVLFLALIISLSSCQSINFQEAQPQGAKNLSEFPKQFQGTYLMNKEISDDLKSITINETECSLYFSSDKVIHKDDFEDNTDFELRGNIVYSSDPKGTFNSVIKGDSVYFTAEGSETHLNLKEENPVIRIFQGKLIISELMSNGFWHLSVAEKDGQDIHFYDLSWDDGDTAEELKQAAREITTFHSRGIIEGKEKFYLNPSKKEFKRLLQIWGDANEKKIILTKAK